MENYFWNTEEKETRKKLYILIIYDIVDNKRRIRFAKKMSGYGFRVQKSAFEAMIPENLYRNLLREIPMLINSKEDNVRVYKVRGRGEVTLFGESIQIENEEVVIIYRKWRKNGENNLIYTGRWNRSDIINKLSGWFHVTYL